MQKPPQNGLIMALLVKWMPRCQLIQELQAINETICVRAANQALKGGEMQFHDLIYVRCLRIHIYAR